MITKNLWFSKTSTYRLCVGIIIIQHLVPNHILCPVTTSCAHTGYLVPSHNISAQSQHLVPSHNMLCPVTTCCVQSQHVVPSHNILCRVYQLDINFEQFTAALFCPQKSARKAGATLSDYFYIRSAQAYWLNQTASQIIYITCINERSQTVIKGWLST